MEKVYTYDDILAMEKQYRTNFVNALPGIRNASLIGTINNKGETNLAIFNSVMHIGAHPPFMGFMMRPVSVPRGTYANIKETGHFTINHVHDTIFRQAHQTSARYTTSEFEATGLTPEFSAGISAPYVKESRVKIGLQYEEELPVKCNGTILIVGRVQEVIIDEGYLSDDGVLQLNLTGSMGVNGLETYYKVNKIDTLPYAKP